MKKDNRKFFFVGARFYCLEKMLDLNLNIVCFATVKDSFADRELIKRNIKHIQIENKSQLLELIQNTEFDVLVSNGCPYIIPVSKVRKGNELFINIHPSLLPDLKGINPINGAILFNRPQGATCHIMDDGIDTGNIITQITVTKKPTMPLDLLYQLSFMAEAKAFVAAYKRNFKVSKINKKTKSAIYYSRKDEDMIITKKDDYKTMDKKVKAFATDGQYARFIKNDITYYVKELINIDTILFDNDKYKNDEIIHIYKDNVITKEKDKYLLWRLSSTEGLTKGSKLLG